MHLQSLITTKCHPLSYHSFLIRLLCASKFGNNQHTCLSNNRYHLDPIKYHSSFRSWFFNRHIFMMPRVTIWWTTKSMKMKYKIKNMTNIIGKRLLRCLCLCVCVCNIKDYFAMNHPSIQEMLLSLWKAFFNSHWNMPFSLQ